MSNDEVIKRQSELILLVVKLGEKTNTHADDIKLIDTCLTYRR